MDSTTPPENQTPTPATAPGLTPEPQPEQTQGQTPEPTSTTTPPAPGPQPATPSRKKPMVLVAIVVVLLLAGAGGFWLWRAHHHKPATASTAKHTTNKSVAKTTPTPQVPGLQLDTTKNYGNKYASGVLPVGDGKYDSSAPKQGTVYVCSQYAHNLATDPGGAMARGPWFTNNNTSYDITKKPSVGGSVSWHGSLANTVSGSTRTIVSNDLPVSDPTGIFPIRSTDAAYQYDRNPNTIQAQSFTYALAASPAYSQTPTCESGTVGVMLSGVELNNAFDAGGRDAGAWEVQDGCSGHPQNQGAYHYHTLSACIKDTSVHTVIGFALDGFPITGPTVAKNNILTTADLDECHGIVSQVMLDGKSTTMYHYVMTQDFPYSVSCFRGTPVTPPGQAEHAQNQRPAPQP